jgi:hypothetical protein
MRLAWQPARDVAARRRPACLQVGRVPGFPLWSLAVITIDVIVIYQLTARW